MSNALSALFLGARDRTRDCRQIFLAFAALLIASGAHAVPIQFEYNDTVSISLIAGVTAGQSANLTLTLDNGGATTLLQTWAAADLQAVTWDFANGGLVTTFSSPFDGGLVETTGSFTTNGAGDLTAVPTFWYDNSITTDSVTTGAGSNFAWFINGGNYVYAEGGDGIGLAGVSGITDAANWSQVSTVPVPTAVWLFGSALISLLGIKRKK